MKYPIRIVCAILSLVLYSDAVETMDELVVQSTRIQTPLQLMSSSVEIITQEELQASGVAYVADGLLQQPGISGSSTGGPGQVTSLYLRGAKPQHTLILVDGVRMNGQLDLNGYDLANLDITGIERIEILKGPQSTLYGSDAMAGVINIITRKEQTPRRYLQHEYGRYHTQRTAAGANGGDARFYYAIDFSNFDSDGFSATKSDPDTDGLHNKTLSYRFGGHANEKTEWNATLRLIDARGEYDNGLYDKEQLITRIELRHTLSEYLSMQAGIDYLDLERYQHATDYLSDTRSYDWNLTAQPTEKHTLLIGLEGYEDTYEEISAYSPKKGDLDNHAFLVLWQYKPTQDTALSLSAREDHHSRFGGAFTYQGGLSHTLRQTDTRIHASYGTGFKAPNSFQLNYSPELNPEESRGWEIGLEQALLENRLLLNAALFKKKYSHFIDYFWNGANNYFNADAATSDGFEAGATLYSTDALTLTLAYSYLDNDSSDLGFAERRPMHKIDAQLHYQCSPVWLMYAQAQYVGQRYETDNNNALIMPMQSYTLLHLSTRYAINEKCTLFARIENLTDEEYETAFDFSNPKQGYNHSGRALYGGVRVEF